MCSDDNESNTEKILDATDSFLDRINVHLDISAGENQPAATLAYVQPAAWNRTPVLTTLKVGTRRLYLHSRPAISVIVFIRFCIWCDDKEVSIHVIV